MSIFAEKYAKMTKEQVYITTIRLNDAEAKSKLESLIKKEKELKEEYNKALTSGNTKLIEKAKAELNAARKELNIFKTETMAVNDILNSLSTASISQLNKAAKSLSSQMKNLASDTEEFAEKQKELKKVKDRLAELKIVGKDTGSILSRSFDFLNKNWGAFTQIIQAITGLSATIRSTTNAYAEMEEAMADVRKYTGQTEAQVHEMNEEFKKMDTRTPREKLNALAGDAGRLGITGKESIMEFVDAADKINVALGDDLGSDAVKNIGKLSQTFGEDKKKGLRGAMLATGSAVNELAQSSSAAAGYIVGFTSRLAGVSTQANIAQTDIMGFASVLDQNMQQEETAATALSQLIAKMYQEPRKFAKLAGQDVKQFASLMQKDANKALLTFLEAMQKKGGFDALAPMFDEMGLSGTRATGVLSTLATKLNEVREAQGIASQAYAVGNSVLQEYGVQNETVQAEIDKAKKEFQDLSIELGQDLMPVVQYTISGTSILIKVLKVLIDFVKEHGTALITLTSIYTAYLAAAKADSAITTVLSLRYKVVGAAVSWCKLQYEAYTVALIYNRDAVAGCALAQSKLQASLIGTNVMTRIAVASTSLLKAAYYAVTLQLNSAKLAMTAFNTVVKMNPYGATVTIVLSLVGAFVALRNIFDKSGKAAQLHAQRVKEMSEAQKAVNDVKEKANETMASEKTRLEELNKIAHDNNRSLVDRREAISAIQKIVPDYHASLTNEGKLVNDNTAAIDKYVKSLNDAALAQAAFDKMVELRKEEMNASDKVKRKQGNVNAVKREIKRGTKTGQYGQVSVVQGMGEDAHIEKVDNNALTAKKQELAIQQESLNTAEKEEKVVKSKIKALNDFIGKNKEVRKGFENLSKGTSGTGTATGTGIPGMTAKEKAAAERAARKAEAAAKKAEKNALSNSKKIAKEQNSINEMEYANGLKLKVDFEQRKYAIALEELDRELAIYKKGTEEYDAALAKRQEITAEQSHALIKNQEQNIEKESQNIERAIQLAFLNPTSEIYQDQMALENALFENTYKTLDKRRKLYKESSQEYADISEEMEVLDGENRLRLAKEYEKFRNEYLQKSWKDRMQIELNFAEVLHERGIISEEEYQKAIKKIKDKYHKENDKLDMLNSFGTGMDSLSSDILNLGNAFAELSSRIDDGAASWEDYAAVGEAAMITIMSAMQNMTSYYNASAELEVAQTEKKYDDMIKAAGNNSSKAKKLEEEKAKEVAKIKTKYNNKAMKMEIAQAIASSAMGAINAYASAAEVPLIGYILAPIAAAAAIAAGALQIATIKKQHQAEAVGYYSGGFTGGFTGGTNYRREAGVVHEGEFVANHQAVNNPAIAPVLDLIDYAQRRNTVGSLKQSDIKGVIGGGGTVVAPIVNVNSDNKELNEAIHGMNEAVSNLVDLLNEGIEAYSVIDGPNGSYNRTKQYERLISNK